MTSTDGAPVDAAIIVAGGRARRLGQDKPEVRVGGQRLLDVALAAVDGAAIVVVGPPRAVPAHVIVVREDPPGGGPLAAIAAGLNAVPATARTVAVLAADHPDLEPAHLARLAALRAETGGPVALAEDADGRAQYLLAVWDAAALRVAVGGTVAPGTAVRSIVPTDAPRLALPVTDVDTPADLARARAARPHR